MILDLSKFSESEVKKWGRSDPQGTYECLVQHAGSFWEIRLSFETFEVCIKCSYDYEHRPVDLYVYFPDVEKKAGPMGTYYSDRILYHGSLVQWDILGGLVEERLRDKLVSSVLAV